MDLVTWMVVAAALTLLAWERVIPWLHDLSIIDPGDRVGADLALVDASTGDRLAVASDSPTLVFVFRSTCPACKRATPGWSEAARVAGWRVLAVGLEPAAAAVAYIRDRVAAARPTVPVDVDEFTRILRVQVVPTTLAIDREGRLAMRRAGPLEDSDIRTLRRLAGASER
jgi:thiol-disulfide isomerase/thioredoxin